ncbi:proline--tRNA ligase [Chloropicon primus]|uniref:Proline--tRNA ligase n=1 Tax=Chloropicon primus TaxID=1764295 RepID=A0A5B8MUE7_9CHLO|nr:proline--tRNA ligase [Chloropicon primus]UPR03352.1 proline--tRNA ligase [Chloropicon primus]|eukprot:QDZ24143.1 proline--tRNA ligase [Chloropicon primus]
MVGSKGSNGPVKTAKVNIPSKSGDYDEWYRYMVQTAGLMDNRYPIRGMDVWLPYGMKARSLLDGLIRGEMERTDHDEVSLPTLVPDYLLDKESKLVSRLKHARELGVDGSELRLDEEEKGGGFSREVYWVRHAGETKLDLPLFLRPTSETAMYTMFKHWIRSHVDLPLKVFQIVNSFRYEKKQTRALLRVREIHFFESHTAHESEQGATTEIERYLETMSRLFSALKLPYLCTKRPAWDTFPGAWYTIAGDVVMPDGKTLQAASCHHYLDQWSREFEIKFLDDEGTQKFVHQTTFGMSERLLGAVVACHGDDRGLLLPPCVAPIQVVVIPIANGERQAAVKEKVHREARRVGQELKGAGIRCRVDDRNVNPGHKFFDWEIKGVPLRIEIGAKELANGSVTSWRRGTEKQAKQTFKVNNLVEAVNLELKEVSDEMGRASAKRLEESIKPLPSFRVEGEGLVFEQPIEKAVYETPFDGNEKMAEMLERGAGLKFLGYSMESYEQERACPFTGSLTCNRVILAKTY